MGKEIWKAPPGYEGLYLVSSHGRVKSVCRVVTDTRGVERRFKSHQLRPIKKDAHYKGTSLSKNGKSKGFFIHRLVLETFVGPCPEGMECRHADGDASNNNLSNLRWGTSKENKADMVKHGRTAKGERNGMAKLSDAEREEVKLLRGVLPIRRIAELYNVWATTLHAIYRQP